MVRTVFGDFRIISERKKESRIKVRTGVLRWPYFQFGLSNNYGANFYTWESKKDGLAFFELKISYANTVDILCLQWTNDLSMLLQLTLKHMICYISLVSCTTSEYVESRPV